MDVTVTRILRGCFRALAAERGFPSDRTRQGWLWHSTAQHTAIAVSIPDTAVESSSLQPGDASPVV